jgi:hypothetical protein
LKRYRVIKIKESNEYVSIHTEELRDRTLRIYYKGYTLEYKTPGLF